MVKPLATLFSGQQVHSLLRLQICWQHQSLANSLLDLVYVLLTLLVM